MSADLFQRQFYFRSLHRLFCRVLTMAMQHLRGYLHANFVGCSPPPHRCSDSIHCPEVRSCDANAPRTTLASGSGADHFQAGIFRCLNGTAPVYLADSINRAADVGTRRSLRSSWSTAAVVVPVTRRSTIRDRAFPVAAARAWNSLPSLVTSSSSLSTFKRHLKTYLFVTSY